MSGRGDEPAFPMVNSGPGLTKREWFAGMAMQGLLANQTQADDAIATAKTIANMTGDGVLAARAYGMADAMIAAAQYAAAHPDSEEQNDG